MKPFAYIRPGTLEDAARQLGGRGAVGCAGGTDLLDRMKERIEAPRILVDLKGALDARIELVDGGQALRIGAAATLAAVAGSPLVLKHFPALVRAVETAATPQIRNLGTIGGNLCQRPRCWYFRARDFECMRRGGRGCYAQEGENRYHAVFGNELCAITHPSNAAPALLAYDATLGLGGAGETRRLSIHEFFVGCDEDVQRENILEAGTLVTEIRLALPAASVRAAYAELKEKQSNDWALVSVAVVLEPGDAGLRRAAVALGHVAPVPMRMPEVEAYLEHKVLTPEVAARAGELATAHATPLAQNGYKVQLIRVLVKRALLEAAGR
ncbi:MAG: FAD binding domain-containing protein [Planctomycetes bacterium]|nr:FAD binding domain-containing protein [Planctomycetota bacterium]